MTPSPERPDSQSVPTWGDMRKLTRSRSDSVISGVCGGLGARSPLPAWAWRVGFLLCFFYLGIGFIPYVLLWICVPLDEANNGR